MSEVKDEKLDKYKEEMNKAINAQSQAMLIMSYGKADEDISISSFLSNFQAELMATTMLRVVLSERESTPELNLEAMELSKAILEGSIEVLNHEMRKAKKKMRKKK